jgi:hypothetical protein
LQVLPVASCAKAEARNEKKDAPLVLRVLRLFHVRRLALPMTAIVSVVIAMTLSDWVAGEQRPAAKFFFEDQDECSPSALGMTIRKRACIFVSRLD